MTQPDINWATWLKCPSCEQPAGQPCASMVGMTRNSEGILVQDDRYKDYPCPARKQTAARTPRARKPAVRTPPQPVHPLAPKAVVKNKTVARRRATAQQTMVDAWTAVANRKSPR